MSVLTIDTTMSVPAVGTTIVTVTEEGHPVTGMVIKSYPTVGVAVQTLSGQIVVIEDGREYANVAR